MTIIIKLSREGLRRRLIDMPSQAGTFIDVFLDLCDPYMDIVTELVYPDRIIDLSPYDKKHISMEFIGKSMLDGMPMFSFDTASLDRDRKLGDLLG